jgi:putative ABC transport system permease protein
MYRNYLVTAARTLAREKLYSFINISGLAVGLTCAIFIVLFFRDEISFDGWIPGSEHLYRTEITIMIPGRDLMRLAVSPFPMPSAMQAGIPEITGMTRVYSEQMTVTFGDRHFYESVDLVDPSFFQIIELPLVAGDPTTVLSQPESVVLSQTMARKYFGAADPLGQTLTVSANVIGESGKIATHVLTVTGVLRDLPHNTHLAADFVVPNTSQSEVLPQSLKEDWTSQQGFGYVRLAPDADPRQVVAKTRSIIDRELHAATDILKESGSEFEQPHLTPFRDLHLTTDNYIGGGMRPPGSWTTLYGFAVIALLIVLVACFNFMNMATARATLRAREISLRKTVGATRGQLIVQFLGEAVLTALLALVVALALVEILLPAFDRFLQRPIAFHYLADWPLLLALMVTTIAAGLVSGAYPALVLSRFRPAATLRANASGQTGSGLTRMALVVIQFAVSIGLGIAASVVFRQINFAHHSDLGFNRDGVVIVKGGNNLTVSARESFAHALAQNPGVAGVAESHTVPFGRDFNNQGVQVPGETHIQVFRTMDISPEFPEVYQMQLLAGRFLSRTHGEDIFPQNFFVPNAAPSLTRNDNPNVLINAEAARRLRWSAADAVGKTIVYNKVRATIAGVVGDLKVDGLKGPVLPMLYVYNPDGNSIFSVRVHGPRIRDTLDFIDRTWRSFAPTLPVQRSFLNEAFDNLFKEDERQAQMFSLFVGIAIFIACLGLFGLAAFTAQRRTKEIGVRKVFGARQTDIVRLLLWQFSVPVLIANLIAWPVAYYYLHHWLESYAFRIVLSPVYFVLAGATALVIAWITVIAHALRVARANPIHALRYE